MSVTVQSTQSLLLQYIRHFDFIDDIVQDKVYDILQDNYGIHAIMQRGIDDTVTYKLQEETSM